MAKDVITRFKLETTQYDSKLKNASKELSDFSKTATQAKEGFNQFTKANVDAARALGSMATSSTNAKQKTQELVGAFNEAAKAYNNLSEEQKQSDWAKALAGSLTTLQQRIKDTKQEMQGLGDEMKKGGGLFGGGKLDGMLQVFGGNMMTKAAGVAAEFASEIAGCVRQGIELAKQGEGIRNAFERLGRGDILDGLREATHGTVTDIELMKAAVKFNDFKLPVEELGTMLAFAQQKAKDTGQSIDYMVDSIVTGLGRKSLMILDNLGLSAAEIRSKMAETGDMTKAVGEIIRDQMAKAGDYVETAADRAAQANVSLQNKMEELGRKFAPLQEASNNLWTSMKIGIMDVIGGPLTDFINKLTEAGRIANAYGVIGGNAKVGKMASNLAGVSESKRQQMYQQQQQQFWKYINPREQQIKDIRAWQRGERGEALQSRISDITKKYGMLDATKIQAEVDAAKKMLADYQKSAQPYLNTKANIDTKGAEQNLSSLKKKLKELEAERRKAVKAGDNEMVEMLTKQINQTKQNIGYLNPNALKTTSTKTVDTELQKNQKKINDLTQEYIKLGDGASESARKRQEEIQKEIKLLQERNGLLNLRAEQAQGRMLLKAEDIDLDPKKVNRTAFGGITDAGIKPKGIDKPAQLDDKAMKAVQKTLDKQLQQQIKEQKYDKKQETTLAGGIGNLASGMGQVVGGLEQLGVEIPSGLKDVIGGMQAIASILMGISTTILAIEAIAGADAIIPFARGGIVPTFANGGLIGKAAGGMLIPGNSYSGDNLRMPVDGGRGFIGVNSGEVILSRSQQGVLASELSGGGMQNMRLEAVVSGEQIFLAQNNRGRRTGRGEIVQSRRAR